MKTTLRILVLVLLGIALVASTTQAAKPLKALLSGAKIAIVEGRPNEALGLLDTISINYGPVPEAYQWTFRVYADKLDAASGLDAKRPNLEMLLTYIDSLHMVCDGSIEIKDKKKLTKDCGEYIQLADSTKVKYFRLFYNQGHEQIKALERLAGDLKNETDSSRIEYIRGEIQENIDSCIANMSMAIMVDSAEFSPYVAIADAYDRAENYDQATAWMTRGYDRAKDPTILSQQLAYYFIQNDDYCGAIPFLKSYVEKNQDDLTTMGYLAACYNNCGLTPNKRIYLDSAMAVNRQILARSPEQPDILEAGGRYFLTQAQTLLDSANSARQGGDEANARRFDAARREMFDSSRTYFKKAWDLKPDDAMLAEQYAFTSAILEDCESAVTGFEVVAKAYPDDVGNWTSMGDCYLRMAKFADAIRAYEKVAELTPDKVLIWENLSALYSHEGMNDKAASAAAKAKTLKGQG